MANLGDDSEFIDASIKIAGVATPTRGCVAHVDADSKPQSFWTVAGAPSSRDSIDGVASKLESCRKIFAYGRGRLPSFPSPGRILKILHIVNGYPPFSTGAVGRQCRSIVEELSKRGHFNRVLTSSETMSAVFDRERAAQRCLDVQKQPGPLSFRRVFTQVRNNCRALRTELAEAIPDAAIIWSLSGLSSQLAWELEHSGIPFVFGVFDAWPRQQENDDPWYHWWTAPFPLGPRTLRWILHATGISRLIRNQYPPRQPVELRFRHAFFASRALRDSVAHAGFSVAGSEIVPCCLAREEFPPAALRRPEVRRILWVGKLRVDDDPMTAMQTIQELRHLGAMRFSLDIVGRGDVETETRLHNYLRTSQLGGAVTIRHLGGDELFSLFSAYDLFLHTARNPGPYPQVLLRAMAAQLPIVSTIEGSGGDVVRNGENAIAIRVGDPVDAASKIIELTQDAALLDRIARQGYDDVLNIYGAPVVAGRVERLLMNLMQPA